jgi:hypothetical protein
MTGRMGRGMERMIRPGALLLAAGLVTATLLGAAPAPAADPAPGAKAADAVKFELQGFRSAKFGMTEAEVRRAIQSDFQLGEKDVKRTEHPVQRTVVLTVQAPEVLAGGGRAEIAYVLGYQTHKLIQVGITWSTALDPKVNADKLIASANLLSDTLLSAGYKAATIVTNKLLNNGGLLVFKGSDEKAHTTALMLQGENKPGKAEGDRVLTPGALVLLYIANAEKPDVFKIAPGQF